MARKIHLVLHDYISKSNVLLSSLNFKLPGFFAQEVTLTSAYTACLELSSPRAECLGEMDLLLRINEKGFITL